MKVEVAGTFSPEFTTVRKVYLSHNLPFHLRATPSYFNFMPLKCSFPKKGKNIGQSNGVRSKPYPDISSHFIANFKKKKKRKLRRSDTLTP